MHKVLFIFFIVFSVALADQSLDFTRWNNVLTKHITRGTLNQIQLNLVDYNSIKNDTDFAAFLKEIETTNTTDFTREEFFAFYVNVYNAFAVNMIIKNSCKSDIFGNCGPIASIRNIGTLIHSVWDAPAGIIGGKTYSLDEIEDMLRHPPNGWLTDITLHSSIVCASISCPDLRMTAYGYPSINETFSQMNQSMYEFLNNTQKGMDVNQAKNTITLSHIFSWYQFDFTNQTKTLLSFLVDYVDPYNPHYDYIKTMNTTKPEDVKINFFGYDWDLNGLKTSIPCGSKARPCFPLWVLFIAVGCVIITVASIIIVLVNRRRNVIHY